LVFNEILQDSKGVPIGSVMTYRRPLSKREREVCEDFLGRLVRNYKTEQEREKMPNMRANVAALAGELKALKVDDERAFLMIEAGPDDNRNKWVQCTAFKDKNLLEKLARFEKGDYIQVRGYVRVWSQQVDGKWENHTEVRVEQVANEPPARARKTETKKQRDFGDDDIPF
jgi:hypothetical protein